MTSDAIHVRDYTVIESAQLEDANDDGTITCPGGEETALIEFEPAGTGSRALLHAIGATDASGLEYRLRFGGNDISFTAQSPLGGVNDPFSFTDELGKPLTAGSATLFFTAINNTENDIDLVARAHVEVR